MHVSESNINVVSNWS